MITLSLDDAEDSFCIPDKIIGPVSKTVRGYSYSVMTLEGWNVGDKFVSKYSDEIRTICYFGHIYSYGKDVVVDPDGFYTKISDMRKPPGES